MLSAFLKFWGDEEGTDLLEYAFLAAFVGLATWAICQTLASDIGALWNTIANQLASTN
jgi:Flp pilus assembly pilin Flp